MRSAKGKATEDEGLAIPLRSLFEADGLDLPTGGWLKEPPEGEGRRLAAVRASMLQTVDEATALMRAILDGEFKVELRDRNGVTLGYRTADIREIAMVYKCLASYALPKRGEGDAEGRRPADAPREEVDAFLDRCTPEELATLRTIAERVNGRADAE